MNSTIKRNKEVREGNTKKKRNSKKWFEDGLTIALDGHTHVNCSYMMMMFEGICSIITIILRLIYSTETDEGNTEKKKK